ncbi:MULTISPECIES: hypothetical protein [Thermus]|uniref:hypothetical protein n=1 Tax=Thermus brockianus TaxID=56956 RepID=UPI001F442AE3|nr:hypothetical protein [Thermus brockianus]
MTIVLKRTSGEIEVYGGEAVLISEDLLLKRGAQLFGVTTPEGEEIYEDLHLALTAIVYAQILGLPATLTAYNREMFPVYTYTLEVNHVPDLPQRSSPRPRERTA